MQVVLRQDVEKLGKRGDIVEVANGFARNYLLPRGQAIAASKGIAAQAVAMRTARDRADGKLREEAQVLASKLNDVSIRINAKAGAEGKLFGSVTNADIVEALKEQNGTQIDRKHVDLHEPIRSTGEHAVSVKLHSEVHATIKIEVVAEEA